MIKKGRPNSAAWIKDI